MHVQQQILDWWKSALIAGATAAGSNVFNDRVDPFEAAELPALSVEGGNEEIENLTMDRPYLQRRTFEVSVTGEVRQASGYEAAARDLGLAVEKVASAGTGDAGGLCGSLQIVESDLRKSGEGERAVASINQRWRCIYHCTDAAPDVAL